MWRCTPKFGCGAGAIVVLSFVIGVACGGGQTRLSPTPTDSPTATSTAASTGTPQIAYIDGSGDMWGINTDGSNKRNLTEHTESRCPRPRGLYWSPTGDWIACVGTGSVLSSQHTLVIVDSQGRPLLEMEPKARLQRFSWSPTGQNYAYVLALLDGTRELYIGDIGPTGAGDHPAASLQGVQEVFWSLDGSRVAYAKGPSDTLTIYDLTSQEETVIADGLRPLAWVLGGEGLLVASDDKTVEGMFLTYTANLLDLPTQELKRVPQLDNDVQFWPSPDGRSVAFLTRQEGAEISLLDLTTDTVTPIPGAVPFSVEWIPPDHLAFSPDGSQLFWANFLPAPDEGVRSTAIYRAPTDGSGLTELGQIESVVVRFSPDRTRVLYHGAAPRGDSALWVANIDGSEARLLVEDAGPAEWRPLAGDVYAQHRER